MEKNQWFNAVIRLPTDAKSVTCRCFSVHPWDFSVSHITDSGQWLSPQNAVKTVRDKLAATGGDCVILLVSDGTVSGFIARLAGLAAVLPLPDVQKIQRQASAQAENQATRMIIPAPPASGVAGALPLTFSTLQQATASQRSAAAMQASGGGMDGLKQALSGFKAARQQMAQQMADKLHDLTGKSATCRAFIAQGDDAATAASDMMQGIPHHANPLAAVIAFSGQVDEVVRWIQRK